MKNKVYQQPGIYLMLFLISHFMAFSKADPKSGPIFNQDISRAISYEIGVGATGSFVNGKFIKDFKSRYDNSSDNLSVKTKTPPLYFGTIGAYAIYRPFTDTTFSKFALALGLEYYKRGFTQKYTLDYDFDPKAIQDKTIYTERYALNMMAVPLSVRYGKKAWVEIGMVYNRLLNANKIVRISHKQSGNDALDGGFNVHDKEKYKLDENVVQSKSLNFRLGAGLALTPKSSLRTDMMLINRTFTGQNNLHNYLLKLQLNININSSSKIISSLTQQNKKS